MPSIQMGVRFGGTNFASTKFEKDLVKWSKYPIYTMSIGFIDRSTCTVFTKSKRVPVGIRIGANWLNLMLADNWLYSIIDTLWLVFFVTISSFRT